MIIGWADFNNLITGEHDNKSLEAVLKSIEFISGDIKYKKEGINVLLYKEWDEEKIMFNL